MPFCDQCGAENPTGARFCDQCGAPMLLTTPTMGAVPPPVLAPSASGAPSSIGTITCPACGASAIVGQAFCDECGEPLLPPVVGAPPLVPPQQVFPAPQPIAAGASSNHVPTPASLPAAPAAPAAPAPPAVPAAPAPPSGLVSLKAVRIIIPQRGVTLVLSDTAQATIGRADPVSQSFPDLDLTPYGGLEQGVGRRHVRLFVEHGQLFLDDLHSTNGTFVNGTKLIPGTPRVLNQGDDVRFGNMPVRIQW